MKTISLGWLRRVFLLVLSLSLMACATEPITGRHVLQLVGEEQLNQMGVQAYQEIVSGAKVSRGTAESAMVQRVGERIARVADQWMEEGRFGQSPGRQKFQWEFTVIDDAQTINAFALPAGKVAFYTGILPVCQDDTGVAVVMGHEVAHAYAQHANNRLSTQLVLKYGTEAVAAYLEGEASPEVKQVTLLALGVGGQLGTLKFSRDDESAADQIGLRLMAEAGYDPRRAAAFWERMAQISGNGGPEFLSTHPHSTTRAEQIRGWIDEMKLVEIYEKNKN